jgi:hypothetical protein
MPFLGRMLLLGFALTLLSGCGERDPRLAVAGTVTFKGEPLDRGQIEFLPPGGKGSQSGTGIVNGRYEIPRDNGLLPGTYEVRIFSYDTKGVKVPDPDAVPGDPGAVQFKERIAPKYNVKSTLKADVKRGNTTFDFSVD